MAVRLAIVQPPGHLPPVDEKDVADALDHIASAAAAGAQIVTFPASCSGPWRFPVTCDPTSTLCAAAKAAEQGSGARASPRQGQA